ncbi:MAG TPA: ECF-type sigma factor [Thermoanaerobaculia bacterium]|jgi:RNA polymerase sigma factor (TIGR02999 family)
MSSSGDVTRLLQRWSAGDSQAMGELLPLLYDELRRLAAVYMRRQPQGHTLQPTALVNEAYLKLAGQSGLSFADRAAFFGLAATVMRKLLIDHARARHAAKRGGDAVRVTLDEGIASQPSQDVDFADLDTALTELGRLDGRQARVIELRFFAGLGIEETAAALSLSAATVKREWATARAWLYRRLSDGGPAA